MTYYSRSGVPRTSSDLNSSEMRNEFALIEAAFNGVASDFNLLLPIDHDATFGTVLDLSANLLTTGKIVDAFSNSTDGSERKLVSVTNFSPAAVGAICVKIQQASSADAVQIVALGDGRAVNIESSAYASSAIKIKADNLQTGSAVDIVSDSASTASRGLVSIFNNNVLSTSTTCLFLQQSSNSTALYINATGNAPALDLDSLASTSNSVYIRSNALTTGSMMYLRSNSSGTDKRGLLKIDNINPSASQADCLEINQSGGGSAVSLNNISNSASMKVVSAVTDKQCIAVTLDSLSSGDGIFVSHTGNSTSAVLARFFLDSDLVSSVGCAVKATSAGTRGTALIVESLNAGNVNSTLYVKNAGSRNGLNVVNSSTLSTEASISATTHAADAPSLEIRKIQGTGPAIWLSSSASSTTNYTVSTKTNSGATTHHIRCSFGPSKQDIWIPCSTNAPT